MSKRRYVANQMPEGMGVLVRSRALSMLGMEYSEEEYREALDGICSAVRAAFVYASGCGVPGDAVELVLEELDEVMQQERSRRKRVDSGRNANG